MVEARIVRVFPRRTSLTPTDAMAFVGDPQLPIFMPHRRDVDEVHVSVTFTWDLQESERLLQSWGQFYPTVRIGGPALETQVDEFMPGMYIKKGATITSRGCNRRCGWCLVPGREGRIRTLPIRDGHNVIDNNLLMTPRSHQRAVFEMLRRQPEPALLTGGLDSRLIDDWVADQIRELRLDRLFLAADTEAALKPLEKAIGKLHFLSIKRLRCYVLVGYGREKIEDAESRLLRVWYMGAAPFAQLYQPADRFIEYNSNWKRLARVWSRPALMKERVKQLSKEL